MWSKHSLNLTMRRYNCLVVLVLALPSVLSVLPTGIISLDLHPQSSHSPQVIADQLCSPSSIAGWGVPLPERDDSQWKSLVQLAESNIDGCASYRIEGDAVKSVIGAVALVDRGNCSFVKKALEAQAAGATGLIVRGTKRAVYEAIVSHNTTNVSTLLDVKSTEFTATSLAVMEKPAFEYDCSKGEAFVDKLATPVWLTDAKQCNGDQRCSSGSCVLTGHTVMLESEIKYQVCCMWDTVVLMGATNKSMVKELAIPVVYVTISDGQKLQKAIDKFSTSLIVQTYRRELPLIDVSTLLIWAMGVATALGAAFYSNSSLQSLDTCDTACDQYKVRDDQNARNESRTRDDIFELDVRHALGFMALAGVFLTILYYVRIGGAIPVLFAASGAAALTQVVGAPAIGWLIPSSNSREINIVLLGETARLSEILGIIPSTVVAVVWYLHRRTYWVLQDIMGIALCFLFLRTVQLPNLKVATLLLTLAFCYDVFFVFLSPIFFGSSVMVDVATGGPAAYTKSDYPGIDYCERYPKYATCVDPEPMPMLLLLPRVLDWVDGVSMLGLGDIILPGLLLSYTLRYDYNQGNTTYFWIVAVGYAVGLGLANLAVTITSVGQPALMYLVPTTLGLLILASKRNEDFYTMWTGTGVDEIRRSDGRSGYSDVELEDPLVGMPTCVTAERRGGDLVPLLSS
ncbi:signal peptide peptidase-aspartyl protease family [Plasmopara halstedii]|uniref:Signal peptide peptidase-aspartyl protease family n=1 Tax=Plasmopara halstedii TaxID=4781 RepID=A0A0P1AIW3_PLAHL|nr:signal peptide peptidase-aspartyl protease family [Plasmopara halstedii]CEG40969.1 signal peptide peptidase-aspartyl protease family [Plasmopara halstedii]|eukprot:XP_024577338.1 signal peptide peptidase-aspartyl protease family [Plasmopara halstedii]